MNRQVWIFLVGFIFALFPAKGENPFDFTA